MDARLTTVRRRYFFLQGLRWLPVGLIAPVLVLILTRSVPLAQVGPLLAIYSATTALLELPTGGLADTIGRRPVLLASSLCHTGFLVLLLASDGFGVLAVAMALAGIGRALDSGPLEAWFVDESTAIDPDADIRSGLARAGTIDGAALAAGAVAGGLVPQLADGRVLAAVAVALVFEVVHLAAIAALMREHRVRTPRPADEPRRSLLEVVQGAFGRHTPGRIHRVFVSAAALGIGLVALESLWQPRFVALLDRDDATAFLGVLLAVAFAASAVGAAAAPAFARRLQHLVEPATVAQTATGAVLVGLAVAGRPQVAAVLFVVFYALLGVLGPLRSDLLHRQVTSAHRSTALSGDSLALQAGGLLAALTLPALADGHGIPLAWMIAGVALAAGAPFLLRLADRD